MHTTGSPDKTSLTYSPWTTMQSWQVAVPRGLLKIFSYCNWSSEVKGEAQQLEKNNSWGVWPPNFVTCQHHTHWLKYMMVQISGVILLYVLLTLSVIGMASPTITRNIRVKSCMGKVDRHFQSSSWSIISWWKKKRCRKEITSCGSQSVVVFLCVL